VAPTKKTKSVNDRAASIDLASFIQNNPWSTVETKGSELRVKSPWNDVSLELVTNNLKVRREFKCLNNLVLPERLNAIYHVDRKQIEYIFDDLFGIEDPLPSQNFVFRWRSHDHVCHYEAASDRLLFLARVFKPVSGTSSDYRNLLELRNLQLQKRLPKKMSDYYKSQKPVSFYIDNLLSYEEEYLLSLSKHLNFYMGYFNRVSPQIEVRMASTLPASVRSGPKTIEIIPPMITAVDLDPFLLDLNLAATFGDTRLRILYYYQILEYGAFYWVEDSVKSAICKILQAPDLQSNLEDYFPKLIEALVPTRQNDEHKIRKVIECRVEPQAIWAEIRAKMEYFSSGHVFEGGFRLEPIVSPDTTEEAFAKMWSPKLFETIRAIRNSLVHARESRTEAVISPTVGNSSLLRPWISVVRRMAEQVTIYDR
jgi:hypothetical protein